MRRGFTIHWNGPAARCIGQPHARCTSFWNAVRNYHVNVRHWSDIAYSFGVCPHGELFVGRGWTKPQFANGADEVGTNDGRDADWYTVIAFLGEGEHPTQEMVVGVANLIDTGRTARLCGTQVLPHNAFKRKTCPGVEFTAYARKWDRAPIPEATTSQPPAPSPDPEELSMADISTIEARLDTIEEKLDRIFARQIPENTEREDIRLLRQVAVKLGIITTPEG